MGFSPMTGWRSGRRRGAGSRLARRAAGCTPLAAALFLSGAKRSPEVIPHHRVSMAHGGGRGARTCTVRLERGAAHRLERAARQLGGV